MCFSPFCLWVGVGLWSADGTIPARLVRGVVLVLWWNFSLERMRNAFSGAILDIVMGSLVGFSSFLDCLDCMEKLIRFGFSLVRNWLFVLNE